MLIACENDPERSKKNISCKHFKTPKRIIKKSAAIKYKIGNAGQYMTASQSRQYEQNSICDVSASSVKLSPVK